MQHQQVLLLVYHSSQLWTYGYDPKVLPALPRSGSNTMCHESLHSFAWVVSGFMCGETAGRSNRGSRHMQHINGVVRTHSLLTCRCYNINIINIIGIIGFIMISIMMSISHTIPQALWTVIVKQVSNSISQQLSSAQLCSAVCPFSVNKISTYIYTYIWDLFFFLASYGLTLQGQLASVNWCWTKLCAKDSANNCQAIYIYRYFQLLS